MNLCWIWTWRSTRTWRSFEALSIIYTNFSKCFVKKCRVIYIFFQENAIWRAQLILRYFLNASNKPVKLVYLVSKRCSFQLWWFERSLAIIKILTASSMSRAELFYKNINSFEFIRFQLLRLLSIICYIMGLLWVVLIFYLQALRNLHKVCNTFYYNWLVMLSTEEYCAFFKPDIIKKTSWQVLCCFVVVNLLSKSFSFVGRDDRYPF